MSIQKVLHNLTHAWSIRQMCLDSSCTQRKQRTLLQNIKQCSTWLYRLGFRQPKLNSKASLPHKPGDGTPFSHPWNASAVPALGCHQGRSIGPTALFGAASLSAARASERRRSKDWWCGRRQSGPRNESPFPGSEPRNLRANLFLVEKQAFTHF